MIPHTPTSLHGEDPIHLSLDCLFQFLGVWVCGSTVDKCSRYEESLPVGGLAPQSMLLDSLKASRELAGLIASQNGKTAASLAVLEHNLPCRPHSSRHTPSLCCQRVESLFQAM